MEGLLQDFRVRWHGARLRVTGRPIEKGGDATIPIKLRGLFELDETGGDAVSQGTRALAEVDAVVGLGEKVGEGGLIALDRK